jgi:hypothetical protein
MDRRFAPVAIVVLTAASYAVALAIGVPILVPFLNTAAAFPFMIASLKGGRTGEAIGRMLVWAAAMAICATTFTCLQTAAAGGLFIHGETYRREMFEFLLTGRGTEGDIRAFLPQHAAHAAVFCLLALATGSLLAMPLGAALMNYMSYYVGALAASSAHAGRAALLAWVPWADIRIASFVTLGVVLAGPLLGRLLRFPYRLRDQTHWLWLAGAGLLLDILLKWALAPSWRHLIRAAAGW